MLIFETVLIQTVQSFICGWACLLLKHAYFRKGAYYRAITVCPWNGWNTAEIELLLTCPGNRLLMEEPRDNRFRPSTYAGLCFPGLCYKNYANLAFLSNFATNNLRSVSFTTNQKHKISWYCTNFAYYPEPMIFQTSSRIGVRYLVQPGKMTMLPEAEPTIILEIFFQHRHFPQFRTYSYVSNKRRAKFILFEEIQ